MMRISRGSGLVVIVGLLVVSFITFGQQTPSCTIFVQPGESIQAAIDSAPEGAVICLGKGTWQENIKIEKSLTLRGAGQDKTTINSKEEGYPVVWIISLQGTTQTVSVKVEGVKIAGAQNRSMFSDDGIGMLIQGSAQVNVTGTTLSGNESAALIADSSAMVIIKDSTIANNERDGLGVVESATVILSNCKLYGNAWTGLYAEDWATVSVTDSQISDSGGNSVWVGGTAKATFTNCQISGSGWPAGPIWVRDSATLALVSSAVLGNEIGPGLLVEGSATATLKDSMILDNRMWGIELLDSAQANISGCEISENGGGIMLSDSVKAGIFDSTIAWNNRYIEVTWHERYGAITLGDSVQATIERNKIIKNGGYGVTFLQRPCFDTVEVFTGHVAGKQNIIPTVGEPDGNKKGAVCPNELDFLMTDEGGELDRRK